MAEGGAYVIDPATGERVRVEWTRDPPRPAPERRFDEPAAPEEPPEPEPEPAGGE